MKQAKFVPFTKVDFESGFWYQRYQINKRVSLKNVRQRFEESGRFDALRFNFHKNGRRPHFYYDSDVAKWMEAVAYLYTKDPASMKAHIALCEELIDCMLLAQRIDGYLNSEHQQIEPEKIFRDRDRHELYCAGHLIEAAIAYHEATGRDRFLHIMERYCDCIERAFIIEKTAGFVTPGHEEIETALFRLYRHTGNEKYRTMAEFFLENRGRAEEMTIYCESGESAPKGCQDDVDIRHLSEANGHCVRALYLYAGIADMALENRDEALFSNLESVYDDITKRKMYITGGVGSTPRTESFTVPYDLPNRTAYSESCCAIAMMRFASRMRVMKKDAKYGHLMERVLYNSLLSSTSLDGKAFFYENPLEIALEEYDREVAVPKPRREHLPIKQRVEVFGCSCCPPNINRFLGELGSYLAVEDEEGLCIEQYITSYLDTAFGHISIDGSYAIDGRMQISSEDYTAKTLCLRLPEWSRSMTLCLNKKEISPTVKNGYAEIPVEDHFTLEIDFHISPKFVCANANVRADVGRMALTYGPLVYCLEGIDNGERLNQISVSPDALREAVMKRDFHGMLSITLPALRDLPGQALYTDVDDLCQAPVNAKFIPYFAFANREESDMLVWVRRASNR